MKYRLNDSSLKQYLEENFIDAKELADKIRISYTQMNAILNGRVPKPQSRTLKAIAEELNLRLGRDIEGIIFEEYSKEGYSQKEQEVIMMLRILPQEFSDKVFDTLIAMGRHYLDIQGKGKGIFRSIKADAGKR